MTHDNETGELPLKSPYGYQNVISERVTSAAANGKIALDREKRGVGMTNIQLALEQAQRSLPGWIKTDAKGAHAIKYATLKAILETVRPVLANHGIRIRQGAEPSRAADDGGGFKGRIVPVYTDLVHAFSGEVERTIVEIPLVKNDPQAMGSALTYGRRYSLLAALGISTDEADDDGVQAMPRDLEGSAKDSNLLSTLKAEISEILKDDKRKPDDKLVSLAKWGIDPKVKGRINHLSEAEAERLRIYYGDARGSVQ